ncbi:hypothetical protein UFOVP393_15 [uncultured Caudovirales phage]|uniref:Uncharacterized protein n=1 Tax=uncultured Caudovirales phage TaxID=2100421 RepID=A0A6J7X3J7_9CAUD|nr:hypothetical protein UFOVP393_15 [uncultured Caudovirales phage]
MNYSELVTAVQDYCENTFPTADMDTMIRLAEQNIYNSVQLANLRKNMTGTLTANNKYLATPEDFLSAYSLAVIDNLGNYTYLLNKDVNFIREAFPNSNDTGLPQYYAIFGPSTSRPNELSFILGPTPDAGYSVELHFYFYPDSIVTTGQTWLGDNFESALFNATMVEAIRFMKGEVDLVKFYKDEMEKSMLLLKNLGDGKQRMDAYRDGQVRNQVI